MKRYQKIISVIAAISLAGMVAACESKDSKKIEPKVVKTEKIVKKEEAKPVSVEDLAKKVGSLSVRVKKLEDLAKSRGVQ